MRIRALDALRGVAILLVLLRHAWPDMFGEAGVVGVVIFFTLSGYLITGILIGDIDRFGLPRYARFYRHRAFRLLPALDVMLVGDAIVHLTVNPFDESLRDLAKGLFTGTFYLSNIPHMPQSYGLTHL